MLVFDVHVGHTGYRVHHTMRNIYLLDDFNVSYRVSYIIALKESVTRDA